LSPFILGLFLISASASEFDWTDGPGLLSPTPVWNRGFAWSSGMEWRTAGMLYPVPSPAGSFHLEGTDYTNSIRPVDVDSDGDEDIAAVVENELILFENLDGEGTAWQGTVLLSPPELGYSTISLLEAADLDSDGDQDIVLAYGADAVKSSDGPGDYGYLYWLENDGTGHVWTEHLVSDGVWKPTGLACGDLDGDGSAEIVAAHYYTWYMGGGEWMSEHYIHWFDRAGVSWASHLVCEDDSDDLLLADIDLDSDLDIAYGKYTQIRCRLNELPSGSWPFRLLVSTTEGVAALASGDLDGDGDPDMLSCGTNGKHIKWFLNPGVPGEEWPEAVVSHEDYAAQSVCVDDMDGDGDLDVLGTVCRFIDNSQDRDETYEWTGVVWLNQPGGWARYVLASDIGSSWTVTRHGCSTGDTDGDFVAEAVFFQFQPGRGVRWCDSPSPADSAILESAVLDLCSKAEWNEGYMEWDWSLPEGTWGAVRVRASDDPLGLGEWSGPISNHCRLEGVVPDSSAFFQYRIEMGTDTGQDLPLLYEVSVSWEEMEKLAELLLPLELSVESPSLGSMRLTVQGTFMNADIDIYDISGRIVHSSEMSLGVEPVSFMVDDLPPGLYLCRAVSGPFEAFAEGVLLP
jgi:hypothetical protein